MAAGTEFDEPDACGERVPDEITHNAAISACSKGGQLQVAPILLSRMRVERVVLNEVTYSTVINACSKGGQW